MGAPVLVLACVMLDVQQCVIWVVRRLVVSSAITLVKEVVEFLGNVMLVLISVKGDVMVLVTEHVSLCQQEWIL